MGRRTIEFDANESGDWFFHCHVLYHMDAGMARVFSYGPPGHEPRLDPAMLGSAWWFGEAMILSNMTAGHLMVMDGPWDLGAAWDVGYAHRDREHHRAEYEGDVYVERFFDENLSARAGGRFTNEEGAEHRAFGGIALRLPLLARARLEADTRGDFRGGLSLDLPLAGRLALALDGHYDTGTHAEGRAGLEYVLSKGVSLAVEAHSDHGIGAGITIRF
jgi:hypothetical protein